MKKHRHLSPTLLWGDRRLIRNDCFGYKYRFLGNKSSFGSIWGGRVHLQVCGGSVPNIFRLDSSLNLNSFWDFASS